MNINSGNVEVFPSTRRSNTDPHARLLSESRIAGIVNKLVDTNGFVITPKTTSGYVDLNSSFEFNIHGYYFKINNISAVTSLFTASDLSIYASIIMDAGNEFVELLGKDDKDTGYYTGISFGNTELVGDNVYNLLLMTRENASSPWSVPDSSRVKFLYLDLGGIGSQISEHETKINNLTTSVTNISTDVSELKNKVDGTGTPENPGLSAKVQEINDNYLSRTELKPMSVDINMNGQSIKNLKPIDSTSSSSDAVNKQYVDSVDVKITTLVEQTLPNGYLAKSGGNMTGNIVMTSNSKISGIITPEQNSDAVNKQYVDNLTPSSIGAAPAYTSGTNDIGEGQPLTTGTLYFVYE